MKRCKRVSPAGRTPVVLALLVAAIAHVPVAPEHLRQAPYMGWLFVGFTVVAVATAVVVAATGGAPAALGFAGSLCAAAIAAYCVTRVVALPDLGDDVGRWGERWGVVSIVSEAVVVTFATYLIRSSRRSERFLVPSFDGKEAR